MDLPVTDVEVKPEKFEEVKEGGPMFHCDFFDTEIVHKIAQVFLPGLASACVDNTIGGLFKSPALVAVDLRKEMVDYLNQRSETFVAESVILEGGPDAEVSDHPYDIISDLVDDFASSKRNLFSQVSGWVLSERREDRIDDFVQEMEINGFWLMDRREAIAQTLLKNVDFKNTFHCNMKFNSAEELAEHAVQCSFRTMDCTNEGCNARFTAAHLENHDSICPFKILPCEQKCSDSIMRREMDRHCITLCPMKLVNCTFYQVGCQSTIPQCMIERHHLENLHSHVLHILQVIHKEASVEDLKERAEQLAKSSSPGRLAEARNVRSLTFVIKDLEAKLGPLKVNTKNKVNEECAESPIKKEECTDSPSKREECMDSPSKREECTVSPTKKEECNKSPSKREECRESPSNKEECTKSPTKKEECEESPRKKEVRTKLATKKEEYSESPTRKEECIESPNKREECNQSPTKREECNQSPTKREECQSPTKRVECQNSSPKKEECIELATKKEECMESSTRKEERTESPHKREECNQSPTKREECKHFSPRKEECTELATKKEECMESPTQKEEFMESPTKKEECTESPTKNEECAQSSNFDATHIRES